MITVKTECSSCSGTGLYQGMAEKEGCAVVCHTCRGTGCAEISYTPFTKRKKKTGVTRVFKDSCGYGHSHKDCVRRDGTTVKFSEGGCTYEEWLKGAKPKPVKELYCPYMWENQRMQNSDHPRYGMYRGRCEEGLSLGSMITDCKLYGEKDECWKIYEG